MESIRVQPSEAFTLSLHTYDPGASPPAPAAIDSDYNGSTGLPLIAVYKDGSDDSSNWTIGTPGGPNTDLTATANRYDVQLTPPADASGLYQVIAAAKVNEYEGSAIVAAAQVGSLPAETGVYDLTQLLILLLSGRFPALLHGSDASLWQVAGLYNGLPYYSDGGGFLFYALGGPTYDQQYLLSLTLGDVASPLFVGPFITSGDPIFPSSFDWSGSGSFSTVGSYLAANDIDGRRLATLADQQSQGATIAGIADGSIEITTANPAEVTEVNVTTENTVITSG